MLAGRPHSIMCALLAVGISRRCSFATARAATAFLSTTTTTVTPSMLPPSTATMGNPGFFTGAKLAQRQPKRHQQLFMSSAAPKADLLCVHVFVTCKPGTEEAFKEASLANARASSKEPGISRFDVIQQVDDPTKFVLIEVYKNKDAPAAHKETEHYNVWRETVADMMAEPRSAIKYSNLYPATDDGWDYGDAKLE